MVSSEASRARVRPAASHLALLAGLAILLVGCGGGGGGSSTSSANPTEMLAAAKHTVDSTPSLHFDLSSENATGGTVYLKSGNGDAARPSDFGGTFDVYYNIGTITLKVVSTAGTFYVQLPFTGTWDKTDPSKYGFSDPGKLLDPNAGLSSLLSHYKTASYAGRDRYHGELLDEIKVTLPGDLVGALLTSADTSQDVAGQVGISVDNGQVRRFVLTGPFFVKGTNSTYTVILTDYGAKVTITPPA
jgi:hypothetical protein